MCDVWSGTGWTPLHEASNHGRTGVARELLRAGADSNAQGYDDNSPLHDAAINGHVEVHITVCSSAQFPLTLVRPAKKSKVCLQEICHIPRI